MYAKNLNSEFLCLQKLSYRGRTLENSRTLSDYDVKQTTLGEHLRQKFLPLLLERISSLFKSVGVINCSPGDYDLLEPLTNLTNKDFASRAKFQRRP